MAKKEMMKNLEYSHLHYTIKKNISSPAQMVAKKSEIVRYRYSRSKYLRAWNGREVISLQMAQESIWLFVGGCVLIWLTGKSQWAAYAGFSILKDKR